MPYCNASFKNELHAVSLVMRKELLPSHHHAPALQAAHTLAQNTFPGIDTHCERSYHLLWSLMVRRAATQLVFGRGWRCLADSLYWQCQQRSLFFTAC
jgi:hypothetical protein